MWNREKKQMEFEEINNGHCYLLQSYSLTSYSYSRMELPIWGGSRLIIIGLVVAFHRLFLSDLDVKDGNIGNMRLDFGRILRKQQA